MNFSDASNWCRGIWPEYFRETTFKWLFKTFAQAKKKNLKKKKANFQKVKNISKVCACREITSNVYYLIYNVHKGMNVCGNYRLGLAILLAECVFFFSYILWLVHQLGSWLTSYFWSEKKKKKNHLLIFFFLLTIVCHRFSHFLFFFFLSCYQCELSFSIEICR